MNMLTATGEKSPFHGKVKLNIQIGKCSYDHEFLLVEIKDNGILGMDFLTKNKCDLMLSKGYLMIYKERIPCFSNYGDKQNTCCRISLNDNVVIPPESEMMVSGKTIDVIRMNLSGIVEPDKNFTEKTGILIAKAAVNLNNGLIPMRLINVSENPYKLNENTVIANFEVIDKIEIQCKNVRTSRTREVLEGVDQLPELLKNLYDESSEELSNSKTFDEHMDHLDQVFNRFGKANLKLNPKKCHLRKEVTFLGHTVSEKGIATDEEKIKAVKVWPIPKNVKQVRSFVGLCSYYRRFVP
ncbi:unnamed protein product [Mytilus coruscus]|uniref:Reverse transcriptase/retrotransposon-derived protein RNase H-like domain-containing protein n=1 Tax=Mytilus coruscus TaxID=42192 RepID=A0A6J8DB00_MYTCO|nr:unnamed protein product [Mytilus coruscus]